MFAERKGRNFLAIRENQKRQHWYKVAVFVVDCRENLFEHFGKYKNHWAPLNDDD